MDTYGGNACRTKQRIARLTWSEAFEYPDGADNLRPILIWQFIDCEELKVGQLMENTPNSKAQLVARIVAGLIILVVIGAIGWFAYQGISYFAVNWSALDRSTAILAVVLVITSLIAARIIANGAVRAERMRAERHLRKTRALIYSRLLSDCLKVSRGRRDTLTEAEEQLLLWGTGSILGEYRAFQNGDQQDVLPLIEQLVVAMRRDIGHSSDDGVSDIVALLAHSGLESSQR